MDYRFSFTFNKLSQEKEFYEDKLISSGDTTFNALVDQFTQDGKMTRNCRYTNDNLTMYVDTFLTRSGFNEWMSNEYLILERYKREEYNTNNNIILVSSELIDLTTMDSLPIAKKPYKLLGSRQSITDLDQNYNGEYGDSYLIEEDNNIYRWHGSDWKILPILNPPEPYTLATVNGWQGIWLLNN